MKCPECVQDGSTSKVYGHGSTQTLMGWSGPFWGEDGERHSHDPNWITNGYRCSEGHYWAEKFKRRCPQPDCTYGREENDA